MATVVGEAVVGAPALGARALKVLTALHRYVGTALCLVLLAWFVSGIVMMYAGYPLLSEADKLARTPPLDWSGARISVAEAAAAPEVGTVDYVRLAQRLGEPVYLFVTPNGTWTAVSATDGRVLPELDETEASRVARAFAREAPGFAAEGLWRTPDQWTIFSSWAPYLAGYEFGPSYKFALGDVAGTEVYVLAATGDVVQETTRSERFWGYVGAVVHWIYPTTFRTRYPAAWGELLVWLSGVGAVFTLLGIVIGVCTYRWRRAAGVAASPYRGWLKWHHYFGLIFGFLASTWLFSGLMSMDPWGWSMTDDRPAGSHQEIMRGGPLELAAFNATPAAALAACNAVLATKELRLVQLRGEPYYWCVETPDRTRLVSARAGATAVPVEQLPLAALAAAAGAIMAGEELVGSELLTDYDAYYYPGWHDKLVDGGAKRLPVVRFEFGDAGRTVLYIDPHSAAPVMAYDTSARWFRWLFHGLHSFDFAAFYRLRPLWDLVMLALMLGGTVLSATGLWVGVKWLGRQWRAATRS